jgi:hypothetical protein
MLYAISKMLHVNKLANSSIVDFYTLQNKSLKFIGHEM